MATIINVSLLANKEIQEGLRDGSMKLFGSIVRTTKNGQFFAQLPVVNSFNTKNPLNLIIIAGVVIVTIMVGIALWFQRKKQFPLKEALTALMDDLKIGNLDLKTAQNLRKQLTIFIKDWEDVPSKKRVQIPLNEIKALQNLLKLLQEINKQIPPQALEAGEVTESMQVLERILLFKTTAN